MQNMKTGSRCAMIGIQAMAGNTRPRSRWHNAGVARLAWVFFDPAARRKRDSGYT
jgi:hypothetical protein